MSLMDNYIRIQYGNQMYQIPNRWELIRNDYDYLQLVRDIILMSEGKLSPAMVRINYICRYFGWNYKKIKDEDSFANLVMLAEQVTFVFRISYPNNDEALQGLDDYTYNLCKRIPPERLSGITLAKVLKRLDYRFTLDLCFCRQFMPYLTVDGKHYTGYTISTSFDTLSTSLTALQFIEARQLIGQGEKILPLMAAILYHPYPYTSESAHQLADTFKSVPRDKLYAISLNFQAFINFLFTKTEYSILTAGKETKRSAISTGALESLYNLSSDGYGDIIHIERMGLLQYLVILRKKVIESVRSLNAAKMELVDIEKETGLPLSIIKQILL
jgi:hypothetical protein